MADNPVVATSAVGVAVGADDIGGVLYQRMKVIVGSEGTNLGDVGPTNPLPVVVSTMPAVSGTVSVQGSVSVSGIAVVSVVPGVSVTIQQGASVSAQVSGTVSISNTVGVSGTVTAVLPGSTTGSSGMSGVLVWLGASQTIIVSTLVSGTVTVNGSVSLSGTGLVSVVPGVSVTIQQGASVSAVVSGTVTPLLNSTTAAPSVSATGLNIWIAGGQSSTAFPVVITGTVTAGAGTTVISGTVTVNNGASVTIQQGASVSAVVSGTVTAILPGSTTGSSGMSGVLVWLGASQTIIVSTQISGTVTVSNGVSVTIQQGASVSAVVSGTVTAVLPGSTTGSSGMSGVLVWLGASQTIIVSTQISGTVTVSNGASVTIQQGASVSAVVSGTVTVSGYSVTTAVPSVSATGLVIWLAGGQSTTAFPVVITGTVTAGAGTTVVSGTVDIGNILITTTGVTTGTAQAVWIMNPTSVTVTIAGTTTGTVSLLSIVPVTTQASVSVSGIPVWFTRDAELIARHPERTNWNIVVSSTNRAAGGTTVLFTVYQGITMLVAGTSAVTAPEGGLLIQAVALAARASITTTPVAGYAALLVSTATPTFTSTVGMAANIPFNVGNASVPANVDRLVAGFIPSGVTIAVGIFATTATAFIGGIVFDGEIKNV